MNKIFTGRMYRWIFALSLLVLSALSGYSTMKPCSNILPNEVQTTIRNDIGRGKIVLLDVRTPEEFNAGHISGAINMNIKSEFFDMQINKLDKTKTYIVYCLMGGRSAKAMALMKEKGFTKVFNLQGGIRQWQKENRPVVKTTK
ncbi:MAG: rhodanese-like domain-containing protein [Candidatus Neomarinimicrobiota bacterium]